MYTHELRKYVKIQVFWAVTPHGTLTLKMDAPRSFETSVTIYKRIWRKIPEDWNIQHRARSSNIIIFRCWREPQSQLADKWTIKSIAPPHFMYMNFLKILASFLCLFVSYLLNFQLLVTHVSVG